MKEKPQPPIKVERPKNETDYPHRHSGKVSNLKQELMSKEEIDKWWELRKAEITPLEI